MIKKITNLRQSSIVLKSIAMLFFCTLLWVQQANAQGAVYPLQSNVCVSTSNYTLEWSGTSGTVDHWEKNDGSGWVSVANTNTSVSFITPAPGTYTYRTYINLGGGNFQYSVIATVNVYALSTADGTVSFTYDGSNRCESDNTGTVVLNAGYTGTINKWVYSLTGTEPWSAIGNSTNTLSYNDLPANTYYKVEIQNGICPAVLTTNSAQINVVAAPVGGTTTVAATPICQGATTLLSVSGNSGTSFDWQLLSGVWTNVSTGNTFTPSAALAPGVYDYRVNATLTCKDGNNATVTQSSTSTVSSLTISQTTAITNALGDNVVSAADPTLNNIVAAPSNGSVVRWEYSLDNSQWTPLTNASNTYTYSNLTQTTYYRVVTQNGACAEAYSNAPVTITVAQGGTVTASETSFCSPSTAATLTVADYEATTFTWEKSTTPFLVWTAVQSNVASISPSNLTETTKYRVNVNAGKAYSNTITLTVSPASVAGSLSTPSQSVCSGDATVRTISLSSNTGSVARWEYSNYNGAPWTALANTTASLDFDNITQSTWYRAVVQSGACAEATTTSLKVEVVSGGTVAGTTNICANDGTIRTLVLSGHTGTINYWEKSDYDALTSTWGAYQNQGNGGSVNFTYTNLSKSARYRAVMTSSCAIDVTSAYAEITVNSTSVGGTISTAATVRPGDNTGTLTITGNNGNVLRWEYSLTNTAPWLNIVNTTTSLTYTNLTESTYYRAVVQNGACSEAITANTLKITVAIPGDVAGSGEVCASDPTVRTLTFENYAGTISRWQKSINAGGSWSDIAASATKTSITYNSLTQTTLYRAVITEDGDDIFASPATITVNPLPVPSFTAPTVCLNNATVFTSTSIIPSGTILSHNWFYADGKGASIVAPTYAYAAAGTYAVKLVVISDKLCKDSITQNVVVSPLPATDFTFTNVCENKVMTFTNNTVLGGATLTYAWTFGNGNTSTLADPTNTYPVKGTYDVTLNATANGLCSNSLTKSVTVYENPVANFAFTNICDGTAMSFVNNSYLSTGNLSYAWDFNDAAATSILENPSNKFSKADTFHVQLTVTTANACSHNVSKKVQVYPLPVVDFTPINNCFGQTTTFTNNTTIASGSNTYAWDFKNGNTSSALNPTQTYSAAGSYYAKLTATSDWNCAVSKEKEVIVHYNPKAQFSFNTICAKDTVNFKNLSSSYGDVITYAWSYGDNTTSTSTDPQKVYTASASYPVKLVVSSSFGCKDSTTQNVAVYPNPVANYTYSASTCLGQATVFASSATISAGTIKTYTYDFSNGTTSNLKNPSYTFTYSGTYPTLMTVVSDRGCKDTITKSVVISPLPAVDFDYNSVCASKVTSFTNNTVLVGATLTYAWNFGNTLTSTATNPTTTYANTGTYNVTLVATANGNCSNTISKSVAAFENPVADYSFANVCDGTAMNFASKAYISNVNLMHSWKFNDGVSTSILSNPSYTFSKVDSFFVKLVVTSPNGCMDSITQKVEVYPNPVVDFTPVDNCLGTASVFTNGATIASGTMTYVWDFNDGNNGTATSTNGTFTYKDAASYKVKLTATSNRQCITSKEKGIIVHNNPKALYSFNTTCAKDTVSFQNLSLSYADSVTYTWSYGDASPVATLKSPLKVYATPATYAAKLVATTIYGCKDSLTQNVAIYPNPVAGYTYNTLTCFGKQTQFNSTSTVASGVIKTSTWDFADGIVSNLTNPTYTFTKAGTYQVILKAVTDKGCEDTTSKNVVISPQPIAAFEYASVCAGNSLSLTNTSTAVDVSTAYSWAFGDTVGTSTQTSPTYTFNKPRTYVVKLVAQNASTCIDSTTRQVEIYPNAVVDFSKQDTCAGTTVNFKSKSTIASGIMNYAWDFKNGATSILAEPTVVFANEGAYAVTLKVTSDKGCVTQKTIATVANPNPVVTFTATDVCYGFANQFNSTAQISSGTLKNLWSFGDLATDTLTNVTHAYVGPGTYNVKLSVVSNKGCTGFTTRNTDVFPKPNADFSFTNLCAAKSMTFVNTSSVESGTMSYKWDLGNSVNATDKDAVYTYTKDSTYAVTLYVNTNKTCSDTITKSITVYPLPIVGFTTDSVCDGLTNKFVNTTTIAATGAVAYYQWDFGDLTNSIQINPEHLFLNQGDYTVKLLARSTNGCESTYAKLVTVMPVPVADFSAAAVCKGKTSEFKNLTSNVSGTPTYTWSFGDGSASNVFEPQYLFNKDGAYGVKLVAKSTAGCVDSLTKSIVVYGLPQVKLPADTIVPRGFPLDIKPSVAVGTYAWTPADGLSSAITANVTATPLATTTYVLTVTDVHGCINQDTMVLHIDANYALKDLENTISNILTPDGNGKNDMWVIPNISFYPDNTVYIFDRWGQEVFRATNYQNNWIGTNDNGDKLPDGTYYFVIDFGSSKVVHKGAITIMSEMDNSPLFK